MQIRHALPFAPLGLVLAALPAQNDVADPAPTPASARARLADALRVTSGLPALSYRSIEVQDNAMTRQMREQMGGMMGEQDTEVEASWTSAGLLHVTLNGGDDEAVFYRGRGIARGGERGGEWKLRRDKTAGGQPLPFVLDPGLMFEVLGKLVAGAEVEEHEEVTYKGVRCKIYGFTLTGDPAREANLCGMLPAVSSGGMFRIAGMGGMGRMPDPEVTLDVAVYVDAETGMVQRVRSKAYQTNPFAGMVRIGVGGAGGEVEIGGGDAEEEPAEEEKGLVHKRGLPKRKLTKSLSLADYDVRFRDHGTAASPRLDETARELLKLGRD